MPQGALGIQNTDIPGVAALVNRAQQRLIVAGNQSGWWGTWVKVKFWASNCQPYLTIPTCFARVINMAFCRHGVRIHNQFYEVMPDSVGIQDWDTWNNLWTRQNFCGEVAGFDRGTFPTQFDLTPTNQYLQVVTTDPRDVGLSLIVTPAQDQNGNGIYTTVGNNQINGLVMTLGAQPVTSPMIVSRFGGIQKDITFGDVLLYQVDATTSATVLLARYGPNEQNPAYRRYYLNNLPCSCEPCRPTNPCVTPVVPVTNIPVTALCKLEFQPVKYDTDWLVIGNMEALNEECKAIRYADMDTAQGAGLEAKSHGRAIQLLNQELEHYLGPLQPAVVVAPFGTSKNRRTLWPVKRG